MRAKKIKLLKMLTNFHIGGTERQVANLALGIDSSHFELHLACLRNSGELLGELEGLRVPRLEFRIGRLYSPKTFWQGVCLARYIRRNGIQIVHSYGFYPNVFTVPFARMAGASIVVASIRDQGDILSPARRRIQRIICRLADCVLVNADAIRQKLIEQAYDSEKIVVIRNGIPRSKFVKARRSAALRRELGVSPEAPLVAVFSRLNRMKGIEYFIDAAPGIAAKVPSARFLVVGDGTIRASLEERASRLGIRERMIFTGFRNDVPDLLAEVAVSVLPSLSEGTSNTLLESMAAGVPVVATRVGGNPEVIEDGVSGLLVPPSDASGLASAIERLLQNHSLASKLGAAGRQRVSELFSMDRSVRHTEHLYQCLVEAKGA